MDIKNIHIGETPEAVAEMITNKILSLARSSKHPLRIALSGGSTPDSLFRYWTKRPKDELKNLGVHFWWVDERLVPPESKDSNYGNAFRAFFGPVNYPLTLLHPIVFDPQKSSSETASSYDILLKKHMMKDNRLTAFDLVILGVGDDGHTSSLFPGQDFYEEEADYISSVNPYNGIERVALSYKGILRIPNVVFHVLGEKKKEILKKVIDIKDDNAVGLPAAYVLKHAKGAELYTDQEL